MLDEEDLSAVLEGLADRHPEAVVALAGAVLIRPKADRIVVIGGSTLPSCTTAQGLGRLPDDAAWWLSLTDWGRLEMWGDVHAADAWVRRQLGFGAL